MVVHKILNEIHSSRSNSTGSKAWSHKFGLTHLWKNTLMSFSKRLRKLMMIKMASLACFYHSIQSPNLKLTKMTLLALKTSQSPPHLVMPMPTTEVTTCLLLQLMIVREEGQVLGCLNLSNSQVQQTITIFGKTLTLKTTKTGSQIESRLRSRAHRKSL